MNEYKCILLMKLINRFQNLNLIIFYDKYIKIVTKLIWTVRYYIDDFFKLLQNCDVLKIMVLLMHYGINKLYLYFIIDCKVSH